jgi:GNAT superfamily N-acetyltransferase
MPVTVSPVPPEGVDELLPLIAGYQRFYGATPDDDRNRAFFSRFAAPGDGPGLLLAARDDATQALVGHACLYWTHSSTSAEDVVLMNDLFVVEQARGTGAGRALIDAAAQVTRDRGLRRLTWQTAPDNHTAQRLYDRTGAKRSTWYEYELRV